MMFIIGFNCITNQFVTKYKQTNVIRQSFVDQVATNNYLNQYLVRLDQEYHFEITILQPTLALLHLTRRKHGWNI